MRSKPRFTAAGAVAILAALLSPASVARAPGQGPGVDAVREHFARGDEFYRQRQLDDAVREFRAALRLSPRLAEAHAKLGVIHLARKQYPQAAAAFREAVRHKPSLARARALLGVAAIRSGQINEAVPLLEETVRQPPDEGLGMQAGLLLVEAYHKLGNLDRALEHARSLLEKDPGNAELLYSAYRLYSELGSQVVARLVREAAGSARLHQVAAELLESQGDFVQAVEQYRRAAAKDPDLPGIHRALAVAILNASAGPEARNEAREGLLTELRSNPVDFHAIYQLGEIEWSEGRFTEAHRHFKRAVELHPDFVDALIALGKSATRSGAPGEALAHLERAVRLEPGNEVARYRLAQAYRRLGRNDEADSELEAFQNLRRDASAIAEIYQQVLRKPVTGQTVGAE